MGKYEQNEHLWVIKQKHTLCQQIQCWWIYMQLHTLQYIRYWMIQLKQQLDECSGETAHQPAVKSDLLRRSTWWIHLSISCGHGGAPVYRLHMVTRQLECNHPNSAHVDEMNCRVNRSCDIPVSSQTTGAILFYSKSFTALD